MTRSLRIRLPATLLILAFAGPSIAQSWKTLTTGTETNLRGLGAAKIPATGKIAIWASGSHGVVLRSIDRGTTQGSGVRTFEPPPEFARLSAPGPSDLDFRGIVVFDDLTAYLMSSGEGGKSRIYKTTDGGKTWRLQFIGKDNTVFLDSIACLSPTVCFALGDPISGKFLILKTTDGRRWSTLPRKNLPVALRKEGAFAASNSNLLLASEKEWFVITGGFAARVLRTIDGGKFWSTSSLPIVADSASSGVFAIARSSANRFVAVGGDYANPAIALRIAAIAPDPASSWQSPRQQPHGFRSAVAGIDAQTFVAVGPTGSDLSDDSAAHWQAIPNSPPLNALFLLDPEHLYAGGPRGTIVQLIRRSPPKM